MSYIHMKLTNEIKSGLNINQKEVGWKSGRYI